jgi:glycosyltransferase involved in cell wall biosynthesis
LNLVLVTETYSPEINGVAMTLGHLVDGLAHRGHRLTIVRPRQRQESARFSVTHRLACRQVRLPGVPIPGYPQLRLGLPASGRLRQLWALQRPDLVHVATEGPLGASAISTALHAGIPVTSSFHTNFDQYTGDYRIGWLRPLVAAWLRRVHNRTLRTFVPTHDLLARLAREGYANLRLLSRGVDTGLFNPARRDEALRASWGAAPGDPVVLHVGRMAAEKNYPLLFRTFDALKAAEPRAKLVLVGDGPMLSAYQRQRPDVVFTGFYTGINLARHYAAGDIYLHASVTETFGNVITEALASGLALAAFDYAAAREFVRHGQNGLVAPVHDLGAFVANAVRLGQEPELRRRLALAAPAAVRDHSWDAVIDRFAADLAEAAAEHHARGRPAEVPPSRSPAATSPALAIDHPKIAPPLHP